jgi:pantoate--beta-alanine ligase
MRRVERIAELRGAVAERRVRGERIAFVPTMGALHEGHLALVDRAREKGEAVVMSVFVNPLQFGPAEDFSRYPRDLDADAARAQSRGVDLLFAPSVDEMYPSEGETRVVPGATAAEWEGATRPGHFAGVLTVVAKLFQIVRPDVAVFGRKDLQQAAVIRRMVRDLDFAVEVDVAPTVREPDGLALSSRNRYLSADERVRALALVRSLQLACLQFAAGEHEAEILALAGRRQLAAFGVETDYFAIVDPDTMERVERANARSAAIVAARVGATRLIDNMILGQPE